MATIHWGDGEKGGVGKSLVVRTLIQYHLEKNKPFVAVETDRSNPDVAGIYKGLCQYAVFTENGKQADKADKIFEMAIEKPVIVNLAAQSHRAVFDWIERNQLLELGAEHGVSFCKWFVCNGGYDSLNLFTQSLTSYDSRMQHILVRNWGVCDDWSHVDEDESLQKLIKKYKVKIVNFPKLAYKERNIIDRNRLTFVEALQYKEFGVLSKQRLANFLKAAYAAFDSTGSFEVKKLNSKALEVLDICLAAESPEIKAKVYEILEISELDSSDPMFLVLALTGQMRVLLEAAPADLSKLLTNWKETSATSLQSIQQAIELVLATQAQQADTIRQTLEIVANNCVEDIKEAGMATTSAIADANSETLSQARLAALRAIELKDEVVTLRTSVESDRKTNEDVLKVLLQRIGKISGGLSTAIGQINEANTALRRLQQNTVWIKMADWFSPLTALAIVAVVGFVSGIWVTWLKYNDSTNSLGRDLVEWNRERIIKCADDKNPKCTIWLVPPSHRKK